MKRINAILLTMAVLAGGLITAATPPVKEANPTTVELRTLLTDSDFIVETDTSAIVTFILNKDHEIVVLSVETEDTTVEHFVRARLNYHKLNSDLAIGRIYKVPVKLEGESY